MKKLTVDLKDLSYDILIDSGLRHRFDLEIKKVFNGDKIAVITDENLNEIYGEELLRNLEKSFSVKFIVIKPGEKSKSFNSLIPIYNELLDFKLTRSDLIIAFGGGVVGDLAGFVASTFLRGVNFIQIPTSLLAQVDSSVGGKVAVDLERGKNLVGSFYHPKLVLIDVEFLKTLPEKFFNDGLGEVIKYGAIRDKELFKELESFKNKEQLKENMEHIIYTCCNIKRIVVENDEKDKGERMILNFGHTLGHGIEKIYNYETYSHGEAVAIGMYKITLLSEKMKITKEGTANRIKELLEKYALPIDAEIKDENALIEAIKLDKKNLNSTLNLILIKDIGEAMIHKANPNFFTEKVAINPRKISGEVIIPPSKSMAHRAVIAAALSKGVSTIENIDFSDDIIATIEAMRTLGAKIEVREKSLIIDGNSTFTKKGGVIDCNESGSTLRFLVPISIAKGNEITFVGRGNLGKRPLDIYYSIFNKQNIDYTYEENILNLKINGELVGDDFEVAGNISSQFITGLLFALPLLKDDSRIIITTELQSKGYLDLTLEMLNKFGIEIINKDYKEFIIKGNQSYKAFDYTVEGDYSQGAFFLCANALGNKVISKGLDLNSLQGDKEVIEILERMGGSLKIEDNNINMTFNELKGTIIDASQCPDVIPVLTVVAALCEGETKVINGERLRIKECDRLNAIATELNKIGANIIELENGLIINGVKEFTGGEVSSHNDHRIAMSMAIASTFCKEELIITNPKCVSKSYPDFWNDFKALGGDFVEWNMGK